MHYSISLILTIMSIEARKSKINFEHEMIGNNYNPFSRSYRTLTTLPVQVIL
jgi:hypothetical protein